MREEGLLKERRAQRNLHLHSRFPPLNYILGDKMNCTVRFGKKNLRVPLVRPGSREQGNRAGALVKQFTKQIVRVLFVA